MKHLRSKLKPTKRDAVLNAMLDVVVERGFHDAPVSLLSERARSECRRDLPSLRE